MPFQFSSLFPDRKAQGNEPETETPEQPLALSVLVIDDDVALVRMVRFNLLSYGLQVETAQNGLEGLRRLSEVHPDVIVLDLQMPGMNGQEVFREIRARGYSVPIIIFSAFEPEEARRELGAEAAMEKPFSPDALVQMIQQVASQHR